ncbi:hypothetical protein V8C86DRAFT_2954576, partial [Haematococcus lacustris]
MTSKAAGAAAGPSQLAEGTEGLPHRWEGDEGGLLNHPAPPPSASAPTLPSAPSSALSPPLPLLPSPHPSSASSGPWPLAQLQAAWTLLLQDAQAAMGWCVDSYRRGAGAGQQYHRARYQLALACLLQGDLEGVWKALVGLMSPPTGSRGAGTKPSVLVLNVMAVQEESFNRARTKAKRRSEGSQAKGGEVRSGPEVLRLGAGQLEGLEGEAWWGHCPDYALGTGEDENERECVAAARRVVKLYLTTASLALDLKRLELACAFLLTDRLWAVAMADLAQLAVGLHANTAQLRLLTTPSALSSPRPTSLSPTTAGPTAMGGQQGPGRLEKLEPFWQLFVTYVVEATAGTEHNLAWWMAAVKAGNVYLPDLVTPQQRAQPMNAKMLAGAAAQYVQEVRQQGEGGWEVLLAMAGRMRKRFRSTAAKINNSRVAAVVSSLMQALVAAGEARCLRLHQQLGAACNVTSQGNGVTAAEQVSPKQAGGVSVVVGAEAGARATEAGAGVWGAGQAQTPPPDAATTSSPAAAAAAEPAQGASGAAGAVTGAGASGAGVAAEPVLSQPTAAPQHMGGMPDAATQAVNQASSPEPGATAAGAAAGSGAAAAAAAAGSVTAAGAGAGDQELDPVVLHLTGQVRLKGPGSEVLQCLKQMLAV